MLGLVKFGLVKVRLETDKLSKYIFSCNKQLKKWVRPCVPAFLRYAFQKLILWILGGLWGSGWIMLGHVGSS